MEVKGIVIRVSWAGVDCWLWSGVEGETESESLTVVDFT